MFVLSWPSEFHIYELLQNEIDAIPITELPHWKFSPQSSWCAYIWLQLQRLQIDVQSKTIECSTCYGNCWYSEIAPTCWVSDPGQEPTLTMIWIITYTSITKWKSHFSLAKTNIEEQVVSSYLVHENNYLISLTEFALRLQISVEDPSTKELFDIFDTVTIDESTYIETGIAKTDY